ncbi:MAG: 50S ribosomal protein L10 [Candidatus Njordarchaeia archaeon]
MSSKLEYKRERPIPNYKLEKVKKIAEKFDKYNTIIIFDFRDIPSNLMKEIRKRLWGKGELMIVKNNLAKVAIQEKSKKKKSLAKLLDYLTGMRALFFTNENIFEIARELASIREKLPPKPGKVSPIDIIIPRMNTGYKTGPVMTDFRLAGLPIKMIDGEIWIWEETHYVKKGQKLNAQAAKILALLDISPFEVGPEIVVGYDNGEIIKREILLKPIEEYEAMVTDACRYVYNLSMNLMLPIEEFIPQQIQLAVMGALNVAVAANIITKDTAEPVISKAIFVTLNIIREAMEKDPNAVPEKLKNIVGKTITAKPSKVEEEKPKEEKKEEKKEEEEAVSGLASLFG